MCIRDRYIDRIQGSRENIGLKEASFVVSMVLKNINEIAITNIMFNMYPVGWSKYDLKSLFNMVNNDLIIILFLLQLLKI